MYKIYLKQTRLYSIVKPFLLGVLFVGVGLGGLLRGLQGRGLGHLSQVLGVSLHLWGLGGVHARVAGLNTVADINAAELATLLDSNRSWPSQRLQQINSIGDSAFLAASLVILLLITNNFLYPREFKAWHRRMLLNRAETFNCGVFLSHLSNVGFLSLIVKTLRRNMDSSSSVKNACLRIAPSLEVVQLFGGGDSKFFCHLHLIGFFVHLVKAFGSDLSCSENSSQLSAEEMALLAGERRVRVDARVQVASQHVLDQTSEADVFRLALGQLNPIVQDVVSDPVNARIHASTASLNLFILVWLFNVI